jgi:hypothetical protein
MTKIPTPRILDRKRKEENVIPDNVEYVVYYETRIVDGFQECTTHRVPKSEWPAYEKEHGL